MDGILHTLNNVLIHVDNKAPPKLRTFVLNTIRQDAAMRFSSLIVVVISPPDMIVCNSCRALMNFIVKDRKVIWAHINSLLNLK